MSTNKTQNLNLHSWVETDPVLMREFNENFKTLDDAITGLDSAQLKYTSGGYVGDETKTHTLYFPFRPLIVYIYCENETQLCMTMLAFRGMPKAGVTLSTSSNYGAANYLTWPDNNSLVREYLGAENDAAVRLLNSSNRNYKYFAIGA